MAKSSPAEELNRAVDAAADDETFVDPAANGKGRAALTRRQRQILQMIADGQSTTQVARRLGLSSETVRTHTKAAPSPGWGPAIAPTRSRSVCAALLEPGLPPPPAPVNCGLAGSAA